jgi:hypothetical protein
MSRFNMMLTFVVALVSTLLFAQAVSSKSKTTADESSGSTPELIQPEELAKILQSPKGARPLLYIADNFGKDWVDKGYPVAKGE